MYDVCIYIYNIYIYIYIYICMYVYIYIIYIYHKKLRHKKFTYTAGIKSNDKMKWNVNVTLSKNRLENKL